jgi:hypothetical protein
MNEVIAKLVRDLAWRLRRGGAQYRPSKEESARWGAFSIPWLAPLLVWPALCSTVLVLTSGTWLGSAEFQPLLWVATPFFLYWLRGTLNLRFQVGAYRRLLAQNERFMLVEYAKYLKRQIARARDEPALGGSAEVRRLQELHGRLSQMLQQGAGTETKPLRSDLASEADLAEATIEAYSAASQTELAALDARLPQGLRQRIEELDRTSTAGRGKAAQ